MDRQYMAAGLGFGQKGVGYRRWCQDQAGAPCVVDLVIDMEADFASVDVVNLQVLGVTMYRHVAAEEYGQVFQHVIMNRRVDISTVVILSQDDVGNPFAVIAGAHRATIADMMSGGGGPAGTRR